MTSRYLMIRFGLGALLAVALPAAALAAVSTSATHASRPTPAPSAPPAAEAVTNLTITDQLDKSGVLNVTEAFTYNFGPDSPHAVTQSLPLALTDDQGNQLPVTFHFISATAGGRPAAITPAATSGIERLTLPAGAGATTTPRHYSLHYTLTPVVLRGDQGDVLQFSATGLGWNVPINHIVFALQLAPGLSPQNLTCTSGNGASTSSNCQIATAGTTTTVTTDAPLAPGDALGIDCGFPSGSFTNYLQAAGSSLVPLGIGLGITIILIIASSIFIARRLRPHMS